MMFTSVQTVLSECRPKASNDATLEDSSDIP